ncbi:MAG: beta-glucosidase [Solirubrobacteraceae bacterium]
MDDTEIRSRRAALPLEQKVRLLTGADFWALHDEPAVGLRRLVTSDGPAGVRGERWDEREPSANVPSPTALAATWDEGRIERLGDLLAAECRRKGVDVLLAPTVNLHRTPAGGRHFECFSEDPLLTARIGAAYVRGLQRAGVGATVKHFVANDSETERFTLDAIVDERTLRELYLAPFEYIVRETRPWAVMAAYNSVNGHTMTESPLLRDVLKDEWGWDGLVMSDWFATRDTVGAGTSALDLAMPGPASPFGDALVRAVRDGRVPERAIDDKVLSILRLAARAGALDGVPGAGGAPGAWDDAAVAAELRATAAASFVLARNEGELLPLERGALRHVAIIGPNAAVARTLGGGSATVFPPYTVSPLEGLRGALGEQVEITHSPGVHPHERIPVARRDQLAALEVRFLDAAGTVLSREERHSGALAWQGTLAPEVTAIEVHARVRAQAAGEHVIGCSGVGRYALTVGGEPRFDAELALGPGADLAEAHMHPPQRGVAVTLDAGEEVDVVLRHERGDAPFSALQLNVEVPFRPDEEELDRAAALAAEADVAVVVVGTNEEVESEGFDRDSLALPGRQDELVRRVAAANARTVVVVNAGAPVLLPWAGDVPAVLLAWFPGQEAGNALADVLLGAAEPGGRLPTTWPATEAGLPPTRPEGGVLRYAEGLRVGYRDGDRDARFAFGHGLGYTGWEYLGIDPAGDGAVRVRVRNSGARAGREVVQLYASREESAVQRPRRWLAGFGAVEAGPGEEAAVEIALPDRALAHWDAGAHAFVVEPGAFEVTAGRSSADLRVSMRLER